MRLMVMTCLCCLLTVPSLLAQQPASRSEDETAVREVVRKYMNARELRDAAAIEALFTSDADQQTTSGEWRRGRAQIVPGTLESSRRNAGTRTITVESVRFLTPDVALADGPYEISASDGRCAADVDDHRPHAGLRRRLAHCRDPEHGADSGAMTCSGR